MKIKDFIPPIILKGVKSLQNRYGWFGNYATWEEALADSTHYDSDIIIEKVKTALLKVKNNEAVHERDSVLFDKIEYSWPLLAGLMWIAAQKKGALKVIDFGGSLGSTYFQNRKFLSSLRDIAWCVVEQDKLVSHGRQLFEDDRLHFYHDIDSCLREHEANVIVMSCVLPYIAEPYKILDEVCRRRIEYIILDRMPFIDSPQDRLTVQKVPPAIYDASYPAWFFSEKKIIHHLSSTYNLIEDFVCVDSANVPSVFKGLIFRIK